ncbi:MAG: 3'(2'),5'-bisphosphate nucleotidase CysQ [Pseudomonadota bacterium]
MNILNQSQIKSIVKIALQAGEIAMSYFGGNDLNIRKKSDDSPLTIADSLISELIFKGLQNIAPEIPVICEEGENRDFGDGTFWLIDPIDGTISFSQNDPQFTINIGLIHNKKPVFGLIFAPAIDGLPFYYTDENQNLMRYFVRDKKEEIFIAKKRIEKDFLVIASKRSPDEDILKYINSELPRHGFEQILKAEKTIHKVSSSLKFLYLIEGKADLYLHLRRSMEWDIAAGQALLQAAGGKIMNLDGSEFKYEKDGLVNQPFLAIL